MRPIASARRPGFGVTATVLMTAVLAVGLLAAFTTVGADDASVATGHAGTDAYAIAQSGLERFIAERPVYGFVGEPVGDESVRIALHAGFVDLELHRLRPATAAGPALFALRSRGVATAGERALAERVVAQLVTWTAAEFAPAAAWVSAGARAVAGVAAIDGGDACAATAPIAPARSLPSDDPQVGIDWAGIVSGAALPAAPPSYGVAGTRYSRQQPVPIIRVDGDHELRRNGRGTLIVTGDLLIMNEMEWRGVVLAGGRIVMRPGARISGAVVTGLESRSGGAALADDVIEEGSMVRYDSCAVAAAAGAFGALTPVPGTWLDGWPKP